MTDKFHLTSGGYRLSWTAQGHDNFIVHLYDASGTQVGDSLVNEIPPTPSSGDSLMNIPADGDYYLQIEASTLTWTLTFTVPT